MTKEGGIFRIDTFGGIAVVQNTLLKEYFIPDTTQQILASPVGVMAVHGKLLLAFLVLPPTVSDVQRMRLIR